MNWFLLAIFLNVQNGAIAKVDLVDKFADADTCVHALADTGPKLVKGGLMVMYRCRQADANGVPVPEVKVDADGKPLDAAKPAEHGTTTTI